MALVTDTLLFDVLASDPGSPSEGEVWYNTTEDRLKVFRGGSTQIIEDLKNNYVAATDPTATDDSSQGYEVGSVWVNTSSDEFFLCVDNTATAAVWAQSGAGSVTGPGSSTDNAIARFDGTSGDVIQDSSVLIDDSDNVSGVTSLSFSPQVSLPSLAGQINYNNTVGGFLVQDLFGVSDIGVGVRGVVLSKPGGTSRRYSTITAALAAASSGDLVRLGVGTFAESITIPAGVSIIGSDIIFTKITGSVATGNRVVLNQGSKIERVEVELPNDANAGIFCAISANACEILDCSFRGTGGTGAAIDVQNTGTGVVAASRLGYNSGTSGSFIKVVSGGAFFETVVCRGGTLTTGFDFQGGTSSVGGLIASGSTVTDGVKVGNASVTIANSDISGSVTNALRITNNNADISARGSRFLGSTADILADPALTGGDVILSFCDFRSEKIVSPDNWVANANVLFSFLDDTEAKTSFSVWGEIAGGRPEKGSELIAGEGDSYVRGMVVITTDSTASSTTDGGNLTDVSTVAASPSGSTFTFQGIAANHTILIGSSLTNSTDVLKHWGIRASVDTGSTGGAYVFEIWDGTNWTEVGFMTTHAQIFNRYGKSNFIRDAPEHIRYGIDNSTTWAKKTILGKNLYWSRVRISSGLTTLPSLEQFRLHPSRFEANPDGSNTYHGNARFTLTLANSGNVFGESGGVTSGSFPVGTGGVPTGWNHSVKNSILNGDGDAIYFQFLIPKGTDTSYPFEVEFTYKPFNAGGGATADFICSFLPVEVEGVLIADPAGGIDPIPRPFGSTTGITTNPGQTQLLAGGVVSTTVARRLVFGPFDVSDYYEDDVILIRFELDQDNGGANDFVILGIGVSGLKWSNGGKI